MLPEALRRAAEALDRCTRDTNLGSPEFGDSRYVPCPLEASRFHQIPLSEPGSAVGFVDGGNREILHAPELSVQLARVGLSIFRGGRRLPLRSLPPKFDFLCVARALRENDEIVFDAELFPLEPEASRFLPDPADLRLNSRDDALTAPGFRADISVVGAAARRFAEWAALTRVIEEEMEQGDLVVRDGTLQTALRNEAGAARRAFGAAEGRGVVLTAIAKTSTLFTSTGVSLTAAIDELARRCGLGASCWYYHPIVRNEHPEHRAEIFVCRLHPSSNHVFRVEILREQARAMSGGDFARVFAELRAGSCDLSFPGYPYGLVDVDGAARVRRGEAEVLGALLSSALAEAGAWERVRRRRSATDAHELLDII
ncbi:MAG: DNA double-strand break repair nuclease NurA [Thermoplasmatota archaeon]